MKEEVFIRCILLSPSTNRGFGSSYEKALTAREKKRIEKSFEYLSFITFLKAIEFKNPTKYTDRKEYVCKAAKYLISKENAVDNVDFAMSYLIILLNWAYNGVWKN
ncbi:hypothetical protein PDN20_14620 [Bacillus cereus]|nr:hypothetical protein [Bacillus cereus]MDA2127201.1 hypothetical protein [Bacillus cereus]MDA2149913.1 hypothetical protein [Bacillus cereus]MEB9164015.1 hypothetical protein [Bacillus cereus]